MCLHNTRNARGQEYDTVRNSEAPIRHLHRQRQESCEQVKLTLRRYNNDPRPMLDSTQSNMVSGRYRYNTRSTAYRLELI